MDLETLLLGILQGITEFLPVSSSGHLKIGAALLGIETPDLLFDIVLHVGTLLAVVLVYRETLLTIARDLLKSLQILLRAGTLADALALQGTRLALLILTATVPTGLIGLSLDEILDGPLVTPAIVGAALLVNGVILLASRRADARQQAQAGATSPAGPWSVWGLGLLGALAVGVAQGIAVMPGLSRAGLTITACLLLGVERENAARFSFLLSIPAILGALVLKFDPDLLSAAQADRLLRFGFGAFVAFVVGAFSLLLLIKVLQQARFHYFAWYCFVVGAAAIILTWPR